MSGLAHIIVGVDGRPSGWEGLKLAQRLRRLGGGRLTVACAYPELSYQHANLMWHGMADEPGARRILHDARALVDPSAAVDYVAICGATPALCLQDLARERAADLLVLGGARTATIGRVLGGSVLIAALVDPPCPVAVSPRGHTGLSRPLRRIGVAVDGSAEAAAAMRWARELADEHDGIRELRLIAADSAAHEASQRHGHSQLLTGARDARRGRALEVRWTQISGPVAPELAQVSRYLDLLVIGTHGRGPLSRLLHGSVSADVARSARCPVVAVPLTPDA